VLGDAHIGLLAPGPRNHFRSECCIGKKSVAAPQINFFPEYYLKQCADVESYNNQYTQEQNVILAWQAVNCVLFEEKL